MSLTSVFRLVRHFGRRSPAGTAWSGIPPRSSFPKSLHQARLYSESRPKSVGSIGQKIGDPIFGREGKRVVDVLLSSGLLLLSLDAVHDGIYSLYLSYIAEVISKGFDLLIEIDWQHPDNPIDQFIALIIIAYHNSPESLKWVIPLENICKACGEAGTPILLSACEEVATILSTLPESGVGVGEKLDVIWEVRRITYDALQELLLVLKRGYDPLLKMELQKMAQREAAKKISEESSYSLVG